MHRLIIRVNTFALFVSFLFLDSRFDLSQKSRNGRYTLVKLLGNNGMH